MNVFVPEIQWKSDIIVTLSGSFCAAGGWKLFVCRCFPANKKLCFISAISTSPRWTCFSFSWSLSFFPLYPTLIKKSLKRYGFESFDRGDLCWGYNAIPFNKRLRGKPQPGQSKGRGWAHLAETAAVAEPASRWEPISKKELRILNNFDSLSFKNHWHGYFFLILGIPKLIRDINP